MVSYSFLISSPLGKLHKNSDIYKNQSALHFSRKKVRISISRFYHHQKEHTFKLLFSKFQGEITEKK